MAGTGIRHPVGVTIPVSQAVGQVPTSGRQDELGAPGGPRPRVLLQDREVAPHSEDRESWAPQGLRELQMEST